MSDDEYIILHRGEVERLVQVLTPISHTYGGDYNKWMHRGSKKGKIPLVDATQELRRTILPQLLQELAASEAVEPNE
jgi:hypothetical protein